MSVVRDPSEPVVPESVVPDDPPEDDGAAEGFPDVPPESPPADDDVPESLVDEIDAVASVVPVEEPESPVDVTEVVASVVLLIVPLAEPEDDAVPPTPVEELDPTDDTEVPSPVLVDVVPVHSAITAEISVDDADDVPSMVPAEDDDVLVVVVLVADPWPLGAATPARSGAKFAGAVGEVEVVENDVDEEDDVALEIVSAVAFPLALVIVKSPAFAPPL